MTGWTKETPGMNEIGYAVVHCIDLIQA